jgi:hypothetical protein
MSSLTFNVDATVSFSSSGEAAFAQPRSAVLLQQLSGTSKLAGVTPASRLEVRPAPDRASSGIVQIDAFTGGLPRGCLTEICGPDSSGRTSLLLSALAAATRREEVCTLIDVSDAFHPHSAAAAGVDPERLLWVRCGANAQSSLSRRRRNATSLEEWERRRMEDPVEQALRAADLLLQSSGFGMVIIDLAGVPLKMARRIPLTTWFRFRRAVENTPTILLVIGEQSCAQSCVSLSLQLQKSVPSSRFSVLSGQPLSVGNDESAEQRPSHAELLSGMRIHAEVLHARTERKPAQSASTFASKTAWTA